MGLTLEDPLSPLGELLVQAEIDRDIGRGEAADMIDVARTTYLLWKRGTRPKIEYLPMLSAFCNVPVRTILEAIGVNVDEPYKMPDIPGYRTPLRVIK